MAEEIKDQPNLNVEGGEGEVKDRGLFDFVHKEEEETKPPEAEKEEVLVTGVEKIHIEDEHEAEEKKHGLLHKLHRSHSSSSSNSSSDEEEEFEGEGGIKQKIKKKKQSLKEKLRRGEEEKKDEETKEPAFVAAAADETPATVVVEKVDAFAEVPPPAEEEKKGFLDKIKEKLPGHAKKTAEEGGSAVPPAHVEGPAEHAKEQEVVEGTEGKEKKGFLGKIIEKLHHKTAGEESGGSH